MASKRAACRNKYAKEICKKLEQRGHKIKTTKHLAVSQSIAISADGVFIGIHDPRIQVKQQGTEIAWIEELINR